MPFDRDDLTPLLDDERREADRGPLGLSDAERAVMGAVLMGPLSWYPVEVTDAYRADMVPLLRKDLRVPPDEAEAWGAGLLAAGHSAAVIEGLIAGDWLAHWEYGGNSCVTLTPYSAIRIGVEPFDPFDSGATLWALPADPRRRMPIRMLYSRRIGDAVDLDFFDRVVDPAPGPLEMLMLTEAMDRDTGRPLLDPETGKPVKVEARVFGGMPIPIIEPKKRQGSKKKGKKAKGKSKAKKKVKGA